MSTEPKEIEIYEWLKEFKENFKAVEKQRKNFFDISGFPNWENVNSNFLAFYLNETEDHNFKRLFIESLLDCIQDECTESMHFERTQFESVFSIYREYESNKGGRIDLVLKGDDEEDSDINYGSKKKRNSKWAILIENKIHHQLSNDLNDYWSSVFADHKIGIVLSPYKQATKQLQLKNGKCFICITHEEFIQKIENNLSTYFYEADDRHLLFLKEYFANIKRLYQSTMDSKKLNEQLNQFHKHSEEVLHVISMNEQLLAFVNQEVSKAMERIGFVSSSSNTTRGKHFYPAETAQESLRQQQAFRFWVDMNRLRFHDTFHCIFELYHSRNLHKALAMQKRLKEVIPFFPEMKRNSSTKVGKNHFHLLYIEFSLNDFEELGLATKIEQELKRILQMNENNNMLNRVLRQWETLEN